MQGKFLFTLVNLLILLAIVMPVRADQMNTEYQLKEIDEYLQLQVKQQHIPGMAVAIVNDDRVVYQRGFGTAGKGLQVTAETPFFIGSLSKSITALAVMQLVDVGKVVLDNPVQFYLPWFTTADSRHAERITVRHLLNQTSGFTRTDQPPMRLARNASIESAVRVLADMKASNPPGISYAYFNPNYTILGALIEQVSGQSYQKYIQEHIFMPLEMAHTFTSSEEAELNGLSEGFSSFFTIPVAREQRVLAYDLPAGFIISCAEDMANFLIAQMNDGTFGTLKILSPKSMNEMHRPFNEIGSTYAMGWEEEWVDNERIIAHNGSLQTFFSRVVMLPDSDFGFVVLINQNGLLNMTIYEKITDNITRLLLQKNTKNFLSLGIIYGAAALVFLLDLARHIIVILRLPNWRSKIQPDQLIKKKRLVLIEFGASLLVIIVLIGGLTFSIGRHAARVMIFYYLPEIAVWVMVGLLLSEVIAFLKLRLLKRA